MKKIILSVILFCAFAVSFAQTKQDDIKWLNEHQEKVSAKLTNLFNHTPSPDFEFNVDGIKLTDLDGVKKIQINWNQIEDIKKLKIANDISIELKKVDNNPKLWIRIEVKDVKLKNEYFSVLQNLISKSGVALKKPEITSEITLENLLENVSWENKTATSTIEEVAIISCDLYYKIKNEYKKTGVKFYSENRIQLKNIENVAIKKIDGETFVVFNNSNGSKNHLQINKNNSEKILSTFEEVKKKCQ